MDASAEARLSAPPATEQAPPSGSRRFGTPGTGAGFEELSRQVKAAGLMDLRPGYYTFKIILNIVTLTVGWTAFVALGNSWYQLITAAFLAVAFTQSGFVSHDAGHKQIVRSKRLIELLGLFHGNLLMGVSFGWWVGHHNRHHSHPNNLDRDPDILRRQVIFSPDQMSSKGRGAVSRFIIRFQAVMFYVLLLLEGMRLHMAGFVAARLGVLKNAKLELSLIIVHLVTYVTVVFTVLSPAKAIVFILVHQGLFGLYMGAVFAPNHKGMLIMTDADEMDWLHRQVLTSRNIVSGRLLDFVYGGLNYQIEHHLFPAMPRVNLRHARPVVRQFCQEEGISYWEVSLIDSYREVTRHLSKVSTAAFTPPATGRAWP